MKVKEERGPDELTPEPLEKELCASENAQLLPTHDVDSITEDGNHQGETSGGGRVTREWMQNHIEELKEEREDKKSILKLRKLTLNQKSPEGKVQEVAQLKEDIQKLTKDIREAEEHYLTLPLDEENNRRDEAQPWYGRVYANCTGYLVKNSAGDFQFTNETNTSRRLREWGVSNRPDTPTTSPLDRVFNTLHDRYHVDHYGALAGYRPGLINQGGNKILITKGPKLMEPVKGEWPTIQRFMEGMLKDDQTNIAHGWNHLAVVPLYKGQITRGQVLVLAGPIDSGKSVYQNLIVTPLLGGRVARPYAYMVKRTDFNEDWFESEHLIMEDETPPRDYETQQIVAGELKRLAADETHWCHGKGKKAVTLPPFWRVTVSVNDNPENLRSIPANDETLKDKMHILKVYPNATVELVESLGGQENFAAKIGEELPAYLYHLLNEYEVPGEMKGTRLGMTAYQNPEILEAIEETSPYTHLLEVLERVYSGAENLEKSVLEIAGDLQIDATVPRGVVPQKPSTLGRYLTELTKMTDGAIEKKHTMRGNVYSLTFPKTNTMQPHKLHKNAVFAVTKGGV